MYAPPRRLALQMSAALFTCLPAAAFGSSGADLEQSIRDVAQAWRARVFLVVADGGPVPPTQRETNSHYVYVLQMSDDGRVAQMTKIWNAPWALRELGWGS